MSFSKEAMSNLRKRVVPVLLSIIIILSAIIIYQNWRFMEERSRLLEGLQYSFIDDSLMLSDYMNSLIYSLEHNASLDTLTYVLALNIHFSQELSQDSAELHYYTGDGRYYSWWVISRNIRGFFMDAYNNLSESEARLLEKAGLIAEISNLLRQVREEYNYDLNLVTHEFLNELLSKTQGLS